MAKRVSYLVEVVYEKACDYCVAEGRFNVLAQYDFKTQHGSWAYGCADHYVQYRAFDTLGAGKAQRIEYTFSHN